MFQASAALQEQARIRHRVDDLLAWNAVLMVPTALGPPPPLGQSAEAKAQTRGRLIGINGIAGLCGLPQARDECCVRNKACRRFDDFDGEGNEMESCAAARSASTPLQACAACRRRAAVLHASNAMECHPVSRAPQDPGATQPPRPGWWAESCWDLLFARPGAGQCCR